MKKVLFCLQWYPSFNSANGYCDEQIIEELKKDNGYEIHCLTYRQKSEVEEEQMQGVCVHRFSRGRFWTWYIDQIRYRKTHHRLAERIYRILLRMKELITIPLYPVYEPFQCLRFARAAIRLDRKEHFDLVVAEFHGMDSLWAGYALKKNRPGIQLIPLYWDSLSGGYPVKYLPEWFCRRRRIELEKRIDSISDRIIAMKPSGEMYERKDIQPFVLGKIHLLEIPRVDLTKATRIYQLDEELRGALRKDSINILFSGSPGKRSFDYLFRLLDGVAKTLPVNLIIICRELFHQEFLNKKAEFKNLRLQVLNYMPYGRLAGVLSSCDVLLNVGNESRFLVPSKVYDYISYAKPIISMYSIDQDTSKAVLEEYPGLLLLDERRDLAENIVKTESFLQSLNSLSISPSNLATRYRNATGQAYVDVLKGLS